MSPIDETKSTTVSTQDPFAELRAAIEMEVPLIGNMSDAKSRNEAWEKSTQRYLAFLKSATPATVGRLLLMYDKAVKEAAKPSAEAIFSKMDECKRLAIQFADAQHENSTSDRTAETWEKFCRCLEDLVTFLTEPKTA